MAGNPLDDFTKQAVSVFGHEGSEGYYQRLTEGGQPAATRCTSCSRVAFPPRAHCPECFGNSVEWVPLPEEARGSSSELSEMTSHGHVRLNYLELNCDISSIH